MSKGLELRFSNIAFEPQLRTGRCVTENLKRKGRKKGFMEQHLLELH